MNRHRPHNKLPYRGAWLNIGPEMIHLMELPNPDKFGERPEHGGRDRHFCIGLDPGAVEPLMTRLDKYGAISCVLMRRRPQLWSAVSVFHHTLLSRASMCSRCIEHIDHATQGQCLPIQQLHHGNAHEPGPRMAAPCMCFHGHTRNLPWHQEAETRVSIVRALSCLAATPAGLNAATHPVDNMLLMLYLPEFLRP